MQAVTAHEIASNLQALLLNQLDKFMPSKTVNFTSEDQPWVTGEIKDISRRKKREYSKKRKSPKWKKLNSQLEAMCLEAKSNYYSNIVEDLRNLLQANGIQN